MSYCIQEKILWGSWKSWLNWGLEALYGLSLSVFLLLIWWKIREVTTWKCPEKMWDLCRGSEWREASYNGGEGWHAVKVMGKILAVKEKRGSFWKAGEQGKADINLMAFPLFTPVTPLYCPTCGSRSDSSHISTVVSEDFSHHLSCVGLCISLVILKPIHLYCYCSTCLHVYFLDLLCIF